MDLARELSALVELQMRNKITEGTVERCLALATACIQNGERVPHAARPELCRQGPRCMPFGGQLVNARAKHCTGPPTRCMLVELLASIRGEQAKANLHARSAAL